jgi:hypothetical protein
LGFIAILCAALAALITPLMLSTWRNRGRAENWALALSEQRVWINMRSGDHQYGADLPSVLSLDFSDIREAARHVHNFTAPDSDGGTADHKRSYLELRLMRPVSQDIREALGIIYTEKLPTRSYFGGRVTTTGRVTSFPFEIAGPTTLRVHWSGQNQSLSPRLSKVLGALSQRVGVGEPQSEPALDWETMDQAEFDQYLVQLSRGGQKIAAVSAARQRLDLSLKQAVDFVDTLEGHESRTSGRELQ